MESSQVAFWKGKSAWWQVIYFFLRIGSDFIFWKKQRRRWDLFFEIGVRVKFQSSYFC